MPAFTLTYTGFVNGNTQANLTTQPTVSTTAVSSSGTGYYPITVSGGTSANYTITDVNGRLTMVTQAFLKTPLTTTYGAADFYTFGASTSGVNYSSSNTNVATVSTAGLIHITGAGTITITFGDSGGSLSKSLTVNQAALTITANNQSKIAGSANPILALTYTSFVNGDSPGSLTTQPTVTTTATAASAAGTYPITVSGAADANYTITYVQGTLKVAAVVAGVPHFSYATPQTYAENVPVTPLIPTSTGGTVQRFIYGTTAVFAGSSNSGTANGTGAAASFENLAGVVVDAAGNIYVADGQANQIRKITPAGVVTTLAGTGANGSQNGAGNQATFNQPLGMAIDAAGNLYVADYGNSMIRKITPAGVVSTFTGTYGSGFQPAEVAVDAAGNVYAPDSNTGDLDKFTPAGTESVIASGFYGPFGVAVNSSGSIIYVSDFSNRVFEVTQSGAVTLLAGNGAVGAGNGTGTSATFNNPNGLSIDAAGNVYVDDTGNGLVRVISPAGVVTTLANVPNAFYSAIDPGGNYLYSSDFTELYKVNITGYSISPALPQGLALDSAGTIKGTSAYESAATKYIVSAYNTSGSGTAALTITVTGSNYQLTPPQIAYPGAETFTVGTAITALNPVNTGGAIPANTYGLTSTFAGSGAQGSANGTGTAATFNVPYGATIDRQGNLYISNSGSLIRKITPAGVVSTFGNTTSSGNFSVTGLAVDSAGNIYFTDRSYNLIRKITPAGVLTTFAGSGTAGYQDGMTTAASFHTPRDLAFDASGNLYVADQNNNVIRKITPAGLVSTYAGNTTAGTANGAAAYASFYFPSGVAVDNGGNVYVADQLNNLIREITPSGTVSTLAGSGSQSYQDGTGVAASFYFPTLLRTDAIGNIYVSDLGNNVIRKITPAGIVTTLAGSGSGGKANGIGNAAAFDIPEGLAVDTLGNLFVADEQNNVIRKILLTGYSISPALPAGLAFTPTSGTIAGTPTADLAATDYTVSGYNMAGSSSATINITVVSPPAGGSIVNQSVVDEPVVHAALSPNGDGINDVLTIDNIAKYPQNTFMVMNISGAKVYEKAGYDNLNKTFDGHSSINGALVAKGTYFYMLQYIDGGVTKTKTGYLVIKY